MLHVALVLLRCTTDAQILRLIFFLARRVDNCAMCFVCAKLQLSPAVLGQTWCELQLS